MNKQKFEEIVTSGDVILIVNDLYEADSLTRRKIRFGLYTTKEDCETAGNIHMGIQHYLSTSFDESSWGLESGDFLYKYVKSVEIILPKSKLLEIITSKMDTHAVNDFKKRFNL